MRKLFTFATALILLGGSAFSGVISESLMFVGENTRVLTIASGRPELPEDAPAVADVVTSSEMVNSGIRTLGELLNTQPGFQVMRKESGYDLYIRGIKSGVLLLYDGIPLTTESTKSVYPLGEELDPLFLKRVEIIRGPASVLWGPDAFGGVVNLVLKTGRDVNGVRTRIWGGSPHNYKKISIIAGKDAGWLDGVIFGQYTHKKGFLYKKDQEFFEAGSKLILNDQLEILARISGYKRPYKDAIDTPFGRAFMNSRSDIPFSTLRITYKKELFNFLTTSKLTFTQWNISKKYGKYNLSYRDRNVYAEINITKDLFKRHGLLTTGVSIRRDFAKNAPISIKGYIPEYIASNVPFDPIIEKKSFDTTLKSIFAQYIHRYRKFQGWIGLRLDDHSDYKSTTSYTAGIAFNPDRRISIKLISGTAYRTPYASQFLKKSVDPEKVKNVSLMLTLRSGSHRISIVPFVNSIKNHISEDPYAGYSQKRDFSISGVDISWKYTSKKTTAWANITFINKKGARERYRILDYIIATPDETIYHFSTLSKSVDTGSSSFGSFGVATQLTPKIKVSLKAKYTGRVCYKTLNNQQKFCDPARMILDAFSSMRLSSNSWLEVKLENLFGTRRYSKETFGRIHLPGARLFIGLKLRF